MFAAAGNYMSAEDEKRLNFEQGLLDDNEMKAYKDYLENLDGKNLF